MNSTDYERIIQSFEQKMLSATTDLQRLRIEMQLRPYKTAHTIAMKREGRTPISGSE